MDLWWVYINNIYIYMYICICIYIYMYIYICILVYYHPEGEEYEIFNMSMLLMFFLTIDSRMTIQDAPTGDSTEKD